MIRRTMLKMLAGIPFVGLSPITNAVANQRESDIYRTQTWKDITIVLTPGYDREFENCKFIRCKFMRDNNKDILKFHRCYFEDCGPLSLTNRKDEFTKNTWKHNIQIIGPAIPIEENNRRRANGEIA